jgi:RNA recognition motif-containing protein
VNSKLFVGGLPASTTHADLVKLFGTAGQVFGVKLVVDLETGRSKGFAFVEMAAPADAQAALKKLDGHKLVDRRIFVTAARPHEKKAEAPPAKPGFIERRSGRDRRKPDAAVPMPGANPGGYGPGFTSKTWKKPGRTRR